MMMGGFENEGEYVQQKNQSLYIQWNLNSPPKSPFLCFRYKRVESGFGLARVAGLRSREGQIMVSKH